MENNNHFKIFLFHLLPTTLISRVFGTITRIRLPWSLMRKIIRWYTNKFNVNTNEYRVPSGGFKTFNDFFTRELKEGERIVDMQKNVVVSPVDARVDAFGEIKRDTLLQAKGVEYRLQDLIPGKTWRTFADGSYMTLYLSPADYHRIHSPVSGKIEGFQYVPGRLFTVQEYMVKGLKGLFSLNERLISYIKADKGTVAVCKIGAINVGRISLAYDPIVSNTRAFRSHKEVHFNDKERQNIKKGAHVGTFNLGSTVILLFQYNMVSFNNFAIGDKVLMGQKIGQYT